MLHKVLAAIAARVVGPSKAVFDMDFDDGKYDDVWKSFQQQQMRELVDVVERFGTMVVCFWTALVAFSQMKFGSPTWADGKGAKLHFISFMCPFGFIIMRWGFKVLRDYCEGTYRERYFYIAHNSLFLNLTMAGFVCQIFSSMPTELDRQKAFITAYFIYVAFAMTHCYLPLRWHLAFVSLPAMCFWIAWHWATGFVGLAENFWGFLYPSLELYGFQTFERRDWARYQARHQADDARALSEAFRYALQSMLSSVFDASCECDQAGKILTASPQWQQLFGQQCLNLNLTDLASSPEEAMRVGSLLEQSIQQCGAKASPCAKIETSLFCHEWKNTAAHELRSTLCCVAFPFDSKSASSSRILIGCEKAQLMDKPVEAAEFTETPILSMPSWSIAAPIDNFDVETKSVSTFSYTVTNSYASQPISLAAVATQTESESVEAATQTEFELLTQHPAPILQTEAGAQSVAIQTLPSDRYPPVPPRDRHVQQALVKARRRQYKAAVILQTKKLVLPEFAETPKTTVAFLLLQILQQINPRGKGCCFYHIVLQVLHKGLFELMATDCKRHITPCISWQCKHCFALHDAEEDGEGEDEDMYCHVCFSDNAKHDSYPAFIAQKRSHVTCLDDDGACTSHNSCASAEA